MYRVVLTCPNGHTQRASFGADFARRDVEASFSGRTCSAVTRVTGPMARTMMRPDGTVIVPSCGEPMTVTIETPEDRAPEGRGR